MKVIFVAETGWKNDRKCFQADEREVMDKGTTRTEQLQTDVPAKQHGIALGPDPATRRPELPLICMSTILYLVSESKIKY